MRRLVIAIALAVFVLAPGPVSAQTERGVDTRQRASSQVTQTTLRLLAIGIGATLVTVGWLYARPYAIEWLYPPPPPPSPLSLPSLGIFAAIAAFEQQQLAAAAAATVAEPLPFYEYVISGLVGAIFGNLAYEIF